VTLWIKLLIIMHADKIGAKKKKQSFLIKPQVLTWTSCFLKSTEGHLITDHQMICPRSKIKIDTKNHGKSHFNLMTGQFLFSKHKTIKGFYILNDVCWIFDQSLPFKNAF